MSEPPVTPAKSFTIFRASEATDLMVEGCMTIAPYDPVQKDGTRALIEAGYLDGAETRILCNIPGFHLAHVWFKEGYPLPLHSHDADCLYYIIAGGLRIGTEDLGPRDVIYIPAGVPYTYRAAPGGAELLEFRHATQFSFQNLARGAAFWDKARGQVEAHRDLWRDAVPPTRTA